MLWRTDVILDTECGMEWRRKWLSGLGDDVSPGEGEIGEVEGWIEGTPADLSSS